MKNNKLLSVENLSVSYDKFEAIKNINLYIEPKEIIVLLGLNGAGKSTILKTIIGLIKPKSGKIVFNGENISDLNTKQILSKGISYIMQEQANFSHMTVHDNIELGGFILSDKKFLRNRIEFIYEKFPDLKEKKNKYLGSLSGGEQQLVAFAKGLVLDPELILIDEPSLGLSPINLSRIYKLIKMIRKMGKAILLVEQNIKVGLSVANRGYILKVGTITLDGQANDLLINSDLHKTIF